MLIPAMFLLSNFAAMGLAPGVVYAATDNVWWVLLVGSVPVLLNGYILFNLWSIRVRQSKGYIGSELGALPLVWAFWVTPASFVWALITMVLVLLLVR